MYSTLFHEEHNLLMDLQFCNANNKLTSAYPWNHQVISFILCAFFLSQRCLTTVKHMENEYLKKQASKRLITFHRMDAFQYY